MPFTFAARVVAILALVYGVVRVAVGLAVASGAVGEDAMARYLPPASSTGEMITFGVYAVGVAIAFGTLAEIGSRLKSR